jgi:hypothetical protein
VEEIIMATNWTAAEAIKIIIEGKDQEAIYDITRRFPLISIAVAKGDMETVASAMPSHISMRKLESMLKGEVKEAADEDQDDEEEVEEKPAKKEKKTKEEKPAKKSKKVEEPEEPEDDEDDEEDEDEQDYSEMSAKDLYQLCKKRKIKVEQKQKPAVYIKALEKADKAAEKATESEEEDDDFEDEKPAKKDKKGAGKKKAAEADEDDEWDL